MKCPSYARAPCRNVLVIAVAALIAVFPMAPAAAQPSGDESVRALAAPLDALQAAVATLRTNPDLEDRLPDVEIFAKAGDWILRHNEFHRPEYVSWTAAVLAEGQARAQRLSSGDSNWLAVPGRTVLAYRSEIDESLQPYVLRLPEGFDAAAERRWPLHIVLHGRDAQLNEVSFLRNYASKPSVGANDWIELHVLGRTNNAYRWAGEADVFEALADVKRRLRVDERRIVLRGFSMGGAGSWHLGLHHPSRWCSVGPGAGFVDFYKYQKVSQPLPAWQDRTLSIYNATDVALNACNVPVCTYGGEKDEQLAASTDMVAAAEQLGVPIKILIGPDTGHKFHPDSEREFMAFHHERQLAGRPAWNDVRNVRFVTGTLKYNACEWLTIEEQLEPYRPTQVEAQVDEESGRLAIKTQNVAVLQIARDVADEVELDGDRLPLRAAADGLLPGVYYEGGPGSWRALTYEASLAFPKNADRRKRHNLQGPIDDAFTLPFVCVRGTGTPWNAQHAEWASWSLARFEAEWDKWFRGRVPVVNDSDVTPEQWMSKNLILWGDPGSNSLLAKVLPRLPIEWTREALNVAGESYATAEHGLAMIYPNPLNPRRYVVINSGTTFHAADFERSNAWLFPRLGDLAVIRFSRGGQAAFDEETRWAEIFDANWNIPSRPAAR